MKVFLYLLKTIIIHFIFRKKKPEEFFQNSIRMNEAIYVYLFDGRLSLAPHPDDFIFDNARIFVYIFRKNILLTMRGSHVMQIWDALMNGDEL